MHLRVRTDGGARGNPGPAGIGVIVELAESGKILERHAQYLGVTTNNQAEYRAVLLGLERCLFLGANDVEVVSDSELLIRQVRGEYRVKNSGLVPLFAEVKRLELAIGHVRYHHVPREQNKLADQLANEAMDRGC